MHSRAASRRLVALLAGVVFGVAVCILAAFVLIGAVLGGDSEGRLTSGGSSSAQPSTAAPGDRTTVPDACTVVSGELAQKLAPDADRAQSDTYQASDSQNQCVWGSYNSDRKRSLTVELRAVQGQGGASGTELARRTYTKERQGDQEGDGLLDGRKVADTDDIPELGNEAYYIYLVESAKDAGVGEAVVNVRSGNMMITVHYGGNDEGKPLGNGAAVGGAKEVAQAVVAALA